MPKILQSQLERWLLPAGVEELLPAQAEHLERTRRDLLDLFHSWGYEQVMPPLIEYLETLLVGTGNDLSLQTFKLTDQLNGRSMGIRADMTPQVARMESRSIKRDAPVRLCYLGTVLRTRPEGFSGTRSPFQIGAELYGHAGIESDVEVLRLMVQVLRTAGLKEIFVDLGHVGIFRGLAREANLTEEQESALFDALQRKARAEIGALLEQWSVPQPQRSMLMALAELNGESEILEEARSALGAASKAVRAALENLERVAAAASDRVEDVTLHFDLAELHGYRYQTGVVYAAFVPGHGVEVARGGRYDDIGRVFGRARPATGFSTDLKSLIALAPPSAVPARAILAPWSEDPGLGAAVQGLRSSGERVIYSLPGQSGDMREAGCDRRLEWRNGEWRIVSL